MSKAIMIHVNSKAFEEIMDGKKTIELINSDPLMKKPFKVYLCFNRRVIGEFTCNEIIAVDCDSVAPFDYETKEYIERELCMDRASFWKCCHGLRGYGLCISNPKRYETSKHLSDFTEMIQTCYGDVLDKMSQMIRPYHYVKELKERTDNMLSQNSE